MSHLFRKYISNRGSALFMVLSTMTALTICCMAMYFSVISSRSTQYAVFNQQQSYQSAESISSAVLAAFLGDSNPYGDKIAEIMAELMDKPAGTSITTGTNGFAAFGEAGAGKEADDAFDSQLGAYSITITRLEDEGGKATFDIAVTTSVNGVREVNHAIVSFELAENDNPPAPTQVFAATGYVPNDVFLEGGSFLTDVFFDNEQTVVNAYGGKNMLLRGNLSAGGSLLIHGYLIPSGDEPVTYAIRGNYTTDFNSPVTFPSGTDRSTLMIGGDATFNDVGGVVNANAYVLGHMYVLGNGLSSDNTTYFVSGNVYLHKDVAGAASKIYTNGNIYLIEGSSTKKNIIYTGNTATPAGKWTRAAIPADCMDPDEMMTSLDEKTATNVYYKWIIDDVPEVDLLTGVKKTLYFTTYNADAKTEWDPNAVVWDPNAGGYWDADLGQWIVPGAWVTGGMVQTSEAIGARPTEVLKWSPTEKGCVIEDVVADFSGGTYFNDITLIIDTGLDPDNIYTIRVKANRDLDGDGEKETFMWYPEGGNPSSLHMNILVKGRGSVVIDIPEGVTYQEETFTKFMHYSWFVLGGGTEDHKYGTSDEDTIFKVGSIDSGVDGKKSDENFVRFIHTDCHSGDGCTYTEPTSGNTCSSCGSAKLTIKCGIHGSIGEFCPNCQAEKVGNHEGECINRVGRTEIDSYLATHDALKQRMMGDDGELVYPNVNIFLVSCEESADIRLSMKADGSNIIQNSFFGYIYAPYMTFKAYGNNSGGNINRLLGGLTVSDYVIDDSMSMTACWPDKMPTDLMSDSCKQNQLQGVVSKSWKGALMRK